MAERVLRTLDDLPSLEEKRVLVRVDFNVPVDDAGHITDDTRIRSAVPTLGELTRRGARVVVMSHRGRPKSWGGSSLEVVARRLGELLAEPIEFVDDIVGSKAHRASASLRSGQILLLQNLRYEPGEKAGDRQFAERLAQLGDLYVNDAFGTAHRSDASVVMVPTFIPGYAGRLLMRELVSLGPLVDGPRRPYWAIIGGSKVSDKVGLLGALMSKVDGIAVGGGMANTFLAAQGHNLGASKVEDAAVEVAWEILADAERRGVSMWLPDSVVAAKGFREDAPYRNVAVDALASDEMALDLTVESVEAMLKAMGAARTIFWNGPLGVFEWPHFAAGTMHLARGLAHLDADVVVGGGDSVAAVQRAQVADQLTHVSTGGGAALELLEGKTLPGVEALLHSPRG